MSYLDQPKVVVEILYLLEILNFRVYVLPKVTSRADSKQSEMFNYAYDLFNEDEWKQKSNSEYANIFEWIKKQIVDFTKKYCNETKFIESLTVDEEEPEDYYQWNGLRYFLSEYEAVLKLERSKETWDIQNILKWRNDEEETQPNDILTKEHIWAKENYSEKFGKDHKEKRRLGNFVLLGLSKNIRKKNKDVDEKYMIDEKVDFIIKTNEKVNNSLITLFQIAELSEICKEAILYVEKKHKNKTADKYRKIARRMNDLRETKLIQFAIARWGLPKENLTSFDIVDSDLAKIKKLEVRNYILKKDLS